VRIDRRTNAGGKERFVEGNHYHHDGYQAASPALPLALSSTPIASSSSFSECERVTVSNVASTMAALMVSNPMLPLMDLASLRLLSCGGSPQPPDIVRACIAQFGCEFFVSFGMTGEVVRDVNLSTQWLRSCLTSTGLVMSDQSDQS